MWVSGLLGSEGSVKALQLETGWGDPACGGEVPPGVGVGNQGRAAKMKLFWGLKIGSSAEIRSRWAVFQKKVGLLCSASE